jgi:hypothetical protein
MWTGIADLINSSNRVEPGPDFSLKLLESMSGHHFFVLYEVEFNFLNALNKKFSIV